MCVTHWQRKQTDERLPRLHHRRAPGSAEIRPTQAAGGEVRAEGLHEGGSTPPKNGKNDLRAALTRPWATDPPDTARMHHVSPKTGKQQVRRPQSSGGRRAAAAAAEPTRRRTWAQASVTRMSGWMQEQQVGGVWA